MGASLGCDAPRDSAGRELNSLRDPVLDVDEPIVKNTEGEIVREYLVYMGISRLVCPLSQGCCHV